MSKNKSFIQNRVAMWEILLSTILFIAMIFCGCDNHNVIITDIEMSEDTNAISAQQTIKIPDLKNEFSGLGFTCTGLTYSYKNDSFYVGNFGKMLPSDDKCFPSIVQLSKDCSSVLSEIPLSKLLPETASLQGVTYDNSNDSLWITDYNNDMIYNISYSGELLNNIEYVNANGIAYDSRTDSLWVINNSSDNGNVIVKNIKKSGETILTIDISGIYHSDQLFLDEKNNLLYFSSGANYFGENYVYVISLTENTCIKKYILSDSYTIEGICIINEQLFACNDGLYHSSYSNTNEMKIYNIDK